MKVFIVLLVLVISDITTIDAQREPLRDTNPFAGCNTLKFCMGDKAGCVEDRTCEQLLVVYYIVDDDTTNEGGLATYYHVYLRETSTAYSEMRSLLWFSNKTDPKRTTDPHFPVEINVPYISCRANGDTYSQAYFHDGKQELKVEKKNVGNLDSGVRFSISERTKFSGAENVAYVLCRNRFQWHRWFLLKPPFLFEDQKETLYVHMARVDSSKLLRSNVRSLQKYKLSDKKNNTKYPIQAPIFEYELPLDSLPDPTTRKQNGTTQASSSTPLVSSPVSSTPKPSSSHKLTIIIIVVCVVVAIILIVIVVCCLLARSKPKEPSTVIVEAPNEVSKAGENFGAVGKTSSDTSDTQTQLSQRSAYKGGTSIGIGSSNDVSKARSNSGIGSSNDVSKARSNLNVPSSKLA